MLPPWGEDLAGTPNGLGERPSLVYWTRVRGFARVPFFVSWSRENSLARPRPDRLGDPDGRPPRGTVQGTSGRPRHGLRDGRLPVPRLPRVRHQGPTRLGTGVHRDREGALGLH